MNRALLKKCYCYSCARLSHIVAIIHPDTNVQPTDSQNEPSAQTLSAMFLITVEMLEPACLIKLVIGFSPESNLKLALAFTAHCWHSSKWKKFLNFLVDPQHGGISKHFVVEVRCAIYFQRYLSFCNDSTQ